jgi:putative DNA primase/helicase
MNDVLKAALELEANGISVVAVRHDGSKSPAGKWQEYQTLRASRDTITAWFEREGLGVGVVTGAISAGLEMAEIEGRGADRLAELADIAMNSGLGQLWSRLCMGWLERSPSGGYHWFYRVKWGEGEKPAGNLKLASRPSTATELAGNPRQKKQVIAETRGEGGFVVAAPSGGTVHPSGQSWVRIAGGPDTCPEVTLEEREAFHSLLGWLHEPLPDAAPQEELVPRTTDRDPNDLTPGDDFENRTEWKDILDGWTFLFTNGRTSYWRRPGKNLGISATTGHNEDRDRLFVFTSSTEFEQETPYTKFGAYALLHHQGNHSSAASELRAKGYGAGPPTIDERTKERNLSLAPFTPTFAAEQPPASNPVPKPETPTLTEGNLALEEPVASVTQLTPKRTLTDLGNALCLIDNRGRWIKYVPSRGQWLVWDGSRWEWQDDDGPIVEAMWEVIQGMDDQGDASVKLHKFRSLSRRALEAATSLAKRNSRIRVNADKLDAHPYELNTPTGIICLRTGALTAADPDKLHTKSTGIIYDPTATAPRWEKFLHTTFNGDAEMIAYIQRIAGYAATGEVTHHILPFLFGSGGNGKSQFLDVLIAVLGDYATTAPANFLMAGRDQHETEIARLAGMRVVVCSESNKGSTFDEAKVKLLTGGDKLTARFMHQNHFSFIPTHTLFLMANYQPAVGAGGDSFWRRLRLIPFLHTMPEDEKIVGLASQLIREEAEGILNWLVQGAVAALQNGLQDPATVLAATHAYAEEEDALARFVSDKCTFGPASHFKVDTAVMRREYSSWCRDQGEPELNAQQFGRDLKSRYDVGQSKSNGKRYYTGITIFHAAAMPQNWVSE